MPMSPRLYPWGSPRPYNAWSELCRQRYGGRLQKLSINAGFSCPNRDGTVGTGGCTFCNNEGFSPAYCLPEKPIHAQIDEGLEFVRRRYPRANRFVAYFQPYSNTYASLQQLQKVYGQALGHPAVSGLVIGTRPDCVDEEKLDYLAALSQKYFIKVEYGVESCYDDTLKRICRGHNFADAALAIAMTSGRGLLTGIHMILGLPGESRERILAQAGLINGLAIDTIKFHQLQIVRDTPMAGEYARFPERFALFGLEEYVELMADLVERLRPGIAIDRFSGEIPPRLILGKRWGKVRADQVTEMIWQRLLERDTYQGCLYTA